MSALSFFNITLRGSSQSKFVKKAKSLNFQIFQDHNILFLYKTFLLLLCTGQ